jgi:parallel beta-helix repeat protein
VYGNTITNCYGAIGLSQSSANNVFGNQMHNNQECIFLDGSWGNNIIGNTVTNSTQAIELSLSSDNNVTQNSLTSNQYSISLGNSMINNISGNVMINSSYAIGLSESSDNVITDNYMGANEYAVYIVSSSNNTIFHNSFEFNTYQGFSFDSVNVWDDGYPSGGNYWGDYQTRYPEAQELDSSGIWNTPYVINENNQDNYPFLNR